VGQPTRAKGPTRPWRGRLHGGGGRGHIVGGAPRFVYLVREGPEGRGRTGLGWVTTEYHPSQVARRAGWKRRPPPPP